MQKSWRFLCLTYIKAEIKESEAHIYKLIGDYSRLFEVGKKE